MAGGYIIGTIPDAYVLCKKTFKKQNKNKDGGYTYDKDYVTIEFNEPYVLDSSYGM